MSYKDELDRPEKDPNDMTPKEIHDEFCDAFPDYDETDPECEKCEIGERCAEETEKLPPEEPTIDDETKALIFQMYDKGMTPAAIRAQLKGEYGIELDIRAINGMKMAWRKARGTIPGQPTPPSPQQNPPVTGTQPAPSAPTEKARPAINVIKKTPLEVFYDMYERGCAQSDQNLIKMAMDGIERCSEKMTADGSSGAGSSTSEIAKAFGEMAKAMATVRDTISHGPEAPSETAYIVREVTRSINENVGKLTETAEHVFGRHPVGDASAGARDTEVYRCANCGSDLAGPTVRVCPSCHIRFAGVAPQRKRVTPMQPAPQEVEPEEGTVGDCEAFGDCDPNAPECQDCAKIDSEYYQRCVAKTNGSEGVVAPPIRKHKKLTPDVLKRLDDLHRLAEWITDGVDPEKNTSVLYKGGVNRHKKQIHPKHKDTVYGILFLREVGLNRLLEDAKGYVDHPQAIAYYQKAWGASETPATVFNLLDTAKGRQFIQKSWDTFAAYCDEDGIELTNKQRKDNIERYNEFASTPLQMDDLTIRPANEETTPEPKPTRSAPKAAPPPKKPAPKPAAPAPTPKSLDCPFGCGVTFAFTPNVQANIKAHLLKDCKLSPKVGKGK